MRFSAAQWLWLLLVPLALAAVYVMAQRRRPKYAVRFTNLDLLDVVAPKRPSWRRHLPAVALLAALAAMVVALAHPVRREVIAERQGTVMLALDVSRSMEATDVSPSRINAAKSAARRFVERAPEGLRIGLIDFAASPEVLVAPTTDRTLLRRGIDDLSLRNGTAIGEAIFAGLDALKAAAAKDPNANTTIPSDSSAPDTTSPGAPTTGAGTTIAPRTAGEPAPRQLVVLSDGATQAGRTNEDAAAAAAKAGVPVSTIAFGTANGTVLDQNGQPVPVPVDGPALEQIAKSTGGQFFEAASEAELAKIFDTVGKETSRRVQDRDRSGVPVAIGFVLLLAASAMSIAWFSRLP